MFFVGVNENLTTFFVHFVKEREENIFLEVETSTTNKFGF